MKDLNEFMEALEIVGRQGAGVYQQLQAKLADREAQLSLYQKLHADTAKVVEFQVRLTAFKEAITKTEADLRRQANKQQSLWLENTANVYRDVLAKLEHALTGDSQ